MEVASFDFSGTAIGKRVKVSMIVSAYLYPSGVSEWKSNQVDTKSVERSRRENSGVRATAEGPVVLAALTRKAASDPFTDVFDHLWPEILPSNGAI